MTNWTNYHLTRDIDVLDGRRFNPNGTMNPAATTTGPQMLTTSAALLKMHIKDADRLGTRCGLIGKAWSFSWLTGNSTLQLECGGKLKWETGLIDGSGLVGVVPVQAVELHANAQDPVGNLAWVRGGTTMRELAVWSEGNGLSLITSGDQLGPSLAGAVATGTHGSRLGYGGVQNMVRGMHLITDSNRSVWIEQASRPILDDKAVALFADEVIRDDSLFADALIHLGAMGIVNGAIVEFEPKQLFDKVVPILKLEPIWDEWIDAVVARKFDKVAQLLGHAGTPIFYEFSLNPFDPKGAESVHILYFPSQALLQNNEPERTPRPADAVYYYAQQLLYKTVVGMIANLDLPGLYVQMVRDDLAQHPNQKALPWSGLHAKDEETGARGALFNAGFAIPLAQLPQAISAMCDGVEPLSHDRQFIFTYRFVTEAAGTLAHLHWDESVAIELDGASPWLAAQYRVSQNSEVALALVQHAFDASSVDYCMHWGKLGNSAQLVTKNFGSGTTAGSRVARWRKCRAALLTTGQASRTMQNDLVVQYNLI